MPTSPHTRHSSTSALPCPTQLRVARAPPPVNNVVGNLIVQPDPVFGGGSFRASGNSSSNPATPFELSIDDKSFILKSAKDINLAGGNNPRANGTGGDVSIGGGDGTSINRGQGGSVAIAGGAGHGLNEHGGAAPGGAASLKGGVSAEGKLTRERSE